MGRRGSVPTVAFITHGKIHDGRILNQAMIEAGALCVVGGGYPEFCRLHGIRQSMVLCDVSKKPFWIQTSAFQLDRQKHLFAMYQSIVLRFKEKQTINNVKISEA